MFASDIAIKKIHTVQLYHSQGNIGERYDYKGSGQRHFYELIFFVDCEGYCTYNGKTVHDAPNTIRILPNKPCFEYYVEPIRYGKCIDIYFDTDTPLPDEVLSFNMEKWHGVKSLFTTALSVWNNKAIGYHYQCLALTYEILSVIEKSSMANYMTKKQTEKIMPALDYIHNHYCDADFSYDTLPALCNMGSTYFRRLFVKQFGVPPSKYILSLKLEKACELLQAKHYTIDEISKLLGYNDVYHFSKQFKQNTGVPPSKYVLFSEG